MIGNLRCLEKFVEKEIKQLEASSSRRVITEDRKNTAESSGSRRVVEEDRRPFIFTEEEEKRIKEKYAREKEEGRKFEEGKRTVIILYPGKRSQTKDDSFEGNQNLR